LEVNIDKSKLTDSPYSTERKAAFLFEEDEIFEQVILELKYANPSSFLVSGYRGVGKTSFINRIAEYLKSDFICANINIAKYDGYPRIVKKLIRQLYFQYDLYIV
jgi:predicted AAA+ superfamily ATPase